MMDKSHEYQFDADKLAKLEAENAALKAQLAAERKDAERKEAERKDAERYRWLRERIALKEVSIIRLRNDPNEEYDREVDAAIDAAMKEQGE